MDAKLEYVRKLYNKKLDCGKSLIELTTYDNVAMLWIVDTLFYNVINKAIAEDISSKLNLRKIFMLFYKTIGIYIEFLYDLSLKVLLRVTNRILRKHNQSGKKHQSKIILCTSDGEWRLLRDYETNKLKKTDAFFDSCIKKLNNRYALLGVYSIDTFPARGMKIFMDKLRNWHIPYKPLNLYWSLDVWKEQKNALKYFKKSWSYLINDKIFREMSIYNEKDLYNQIKAELELYFFFLFPLAVKYIEMGKLMIKAEKPDLILLKNEYGWRERPYLVTAPKLENIPTLAVQHGVIHPTHKGYMYAQDEISPKGSVKSPYCPIPDKTAVYGTYHKDLLTKMSAYPRDCVVVTGQPRYDILCHADKIYDRNSFCNKWSLDPNRKIVLVATENLPIQEENIIFLKAILKSLKEFPILQVVIKPHPGERGKWYEKVVKEAEMKVTILPKNSDTFEALYACDLFFIYFSTTGMEAVALNKPVIVVNLTGRPDPVEYVKENVALGVYREDDLKPAIEKILIDDSEFAKNRKDYIKRYLYKIDGKATGRVVELIYKMIEKSKEDRNERHV